MRMSEFYSVRVLVALALACGFTLEPSFAREPDAASTPLTGRAQVVDGDTLEINGVRIRLEGIDAPETAQSCGRRWLGQWSCGRSAVTALEELTLGKQVDCTPQGLDKYGRTLAICHVQGRDINAEMVRRGMAWAFVKFSNRYVKEEAEARAVKAGIWQGPATPAWYWRQQQWTAAEPAAPQGCAIKGNAGRSGLVYHMPWSPWYGKLHMTGTGKRWFCSEGEAIAAGYRSAGYR